MLAVPIVCALFVGGAAAAAANLKSVKNDVQIDGAGVVTAVSQGSPAWLAGVRPGWTAVAISDGDQVYANGEEMRGIVDDPLGTEPLRALIPSAVALVLAGAALLLRQRRATATLAIAAAALSMGVYVARFDLAGLLAAVVPIGLAAAFAFGAARTAGLPREPVTRAVVLGAVPALALAGAWLAAGRVAAAEGLAFAYLAIAWMIVVAGRAELLAATGGPSSRLEFARAVALSMLPFADRVRLTGAQAERDRLAGDLHAELLPAIATTAAALERRGAVDAAETLRDLAREVRDLVSDRRLPILEDDGLVAAAEWLAESLESRAPIRVEIDLGRDGQRQPPAIERAAYRVLQLALDNVIRHSGASTARVTIAGDAHSLTIVVADDGRGIGPGDAAAALRSGHVGLADMRTEAAAVDATLTIESPAVMPPVHGSSATASPGRGSANAGSQSSNGTAVTFRWPA